MFVSVSPGTKLKMRIIRYGKRRQRLPMEKLMVTCVDSKDGFFGILFDSIASRGNR
jgi:hypothetical protein